MPDVPATLTRRRLTTHDSQSGAEHSHVAEVEGRLEQPVHPAAEEEETHETLMSDTSRSHRLMKSELTWF